MSVLQDKSRLIAMDAIRNGPGSVTDPTTVITAVVSIITMIMKLYKDCKKTPAQAVSDIQSAAAGGLWGWFQRRRLWRVIQNHDIPQNVSQLDVYNATLKMGRGTNTGEVAAMFREVS